MASPHERSAFHRFFYGLGHLLGHMEALSSGKADAPEEDEPAAEEDAEAPALALPLAATVPTAAAGWLLARCLRPAPVSWPRVVLAGVTGTAACQLTEYLERRLRGQEPPRPEGMAEAVARYAAGVANAAAYASLLYPRLPGRPLTRGLLFGMLEAAAMPAGGTIPLLRRLAPGLSFPLADLAMEPGPGAGPAAHLAFGLGVGVLYRDGGRRR